MADIECRKDNRTALVMDDEELEILWALLGSVKNSTAIKVGTSPLFQTVDKYCEDDLGMMFNWEKHDALQGL
jgi:hypothetical protein